MINRLLAGVHIAAAHEAITFAAKQGLDLSKVYEVITGSAAIRGCSRTASHTCSQAAMRRAAPWEFSSPRGEIPGATRRSRLAGISKGRRLRYRGDDDASLARVYARVTGTSLPGAPASWLLS
jgi:putative dehydrogenase